MYVARATGSVLINKEGILLGKKSTADMLPGKIILYTTT